MKRFGEKLRSLRKKQGFTLTEIGDELGVHQTFVSQLELNKRKPNAEMILKIADIFGVDINVLMRDELDLD
jgi:transcriptional regulator with XRE-family HTH domain